MASRRWDLPLVFLTTLLTGSTFAVCRGRRIDGHHPARVTHRPLLRGRVAWPEIAAGANGICLLEFTHNQRGRIGAVVVRQIFFWWWFLPDFFGTALSRAPMCRSSGGTRRRRHHLGQPDYPQRWCRYCTGWLGMLGDFHVVDCSLANGSGCVGL